MQQTMTRYILAESVDRSELTLCPAESFSRDALFSVDVHDRPLRVVMRFDAPSWEQAKSVRDAVFGHGCSREYTPASADLLAAAYRHFPRRGDLRMNVARYIREAGVLGVPLLPEDEVTLSHEEDGDPGLLPAWLSHDLGEGG